MKQYDFYLSMSPANVDEPYMGELTLLLLQSGLKYSRHIGAKDNLAARRDVGRLIKDSNALLYVSDRTNNSLPMSVEEVRRASRDGLEIVVVRVDDSEFPAEVSEALSEAAIYDATDPGRRPEAFGDAIRRLGGDIPIGGEVDELPSSSAPQSDPRPAPAGAQPETDVPPVPETVGEAQRDQTRPLTRSMSLSTVLVMIILGIIVVAGVIALILR
ncbi:MAG: hypothetical protein NC336_06100 [Clostridium sp.]|nr:hypothetical protein [Clostridium sp.]